MISQDHYSDKVNNKIAKIPPPNTLASHQPMRYNKSLHKFHKKHCTWPHCIVRNHHPLLKCSRKKHAIKKCYLLSYHRLKAVHRLNKHKQRLVNKKPTVEQKLPAAAAQPELTPPLPTVTRIQHAWRPPINYDTLKELSVNHIFKSLQLRHDLLLDPNLCFRPNLDGPSGRDKMRKAEHYWKRVDGAFKQALQDTNETRYDFLRDILNELAGILVTLIRPFDFSPACNTSLVWHWPAHTTEDHIYDTLDADLIIQQLKHKLPIDNQVLWLSNLLDTLCPEAQHQPKLMATKKSFQEQKYARALKHCFDVLEIIKLNCANCMLRHYRLFLIDTCSEFEYRCFVKQYNEEKVTNVYEWIKYSMERNNENTYYHGLVHLVADDYETANAFNLKPSPFPITLQFDERRLTHQFRYEFQNILVMAILLVPYRHLTGKLSHSGDIRSLKRVYTNVLKSASIVTHGRIGDDEALLSCYQLSLHTCHTAVRRHEKEGGPMARDTMTQMTQFWEEWLFLHLKPTSTIFKLMYDRVCGSLAYYTQHGQLETSHEVVGLEGEIESLGTKLKSVSDLNLEIFGTLYRNVTKCVQTDLSQK